MGSFDRRWRDTPVKTSSCLLLLHLFVSLSSSIPSSPPPPLCLFPLLKSHLPRSGSAPLLRPGTHEGHHGPLVSRRLRFIPTFPSCLQEALDRRPVVLLAAHHTEGTQVLTSTCGEGSAPDRYAGRGHIQFPGTCNPTNSFQILIRLLHVIPGLVQRGDSLTPSTRTE